MAMRFIGVPFDMVEKFWPIVSPLVETVVARSQDHTAETVKQDVLNSDMQLWGYFNDDLTECQMVTVTMLVKFPTNRIWCELVFCSGEDMEEWLPCLSRIEVWARDKGCDGMRLTGRKGWSKVLPGYDEVAVMLRKRF